ncbi:hypothetical protein FM21_35145 [Streptomyces mutabilis]|uniref:Uncharacterized protein n=1 Tax=Streptomyces mutabilis TaxID=67332 RepID=A0A086MRH5_9ACTN|nr:hypothetical protein FM21_35145 [Streptomyces mutabilis]
MTARLIGTEVFCDGPDDQTDCPSSAAVRAGFGSVTARQVRADGRRDGWARRRRAGRLADLCPSCAAAS